MPSVVVDTIYRPSVAAILENAAGRIFIGERADCLGCWQFPQGGREPDEDAKMAIVRELREELALEPASYAIGECRGSYRYLFPPGRTKQGYLGQEQHYFRLRMLAPDAVANVHTPDPEFRAGRWIDPGEFSLAWLPPMKHEVYRRVFTDFFGLQIS